MLNRLLISFGVLGCIILGMMLAVRTSVIDYRIYCVVSGSMEPSIPRGSLVLMKRMLDSQYRLGDVIVYVRDDKKSAPVMHRIIDLQKNQFGIGFISTKGDSNPNGDPWQVNYNQIEGKVIRDVPYAGYLISYLNTKFGFLLIALMTFFFLILGEVKFIWHQCLISNRKQGSM